MKKLARTFWIIPLAVLMLTAPAQAHENDHGRRYDNNDHRSEYRHYGNSYRDNGRHTGWYKQSHAKPYRIGRPLPHYVRCEPVSYRTLRHLRPAPHGTRYVQVDRDILLISIASRNVLGSIALF